MKNLRKIIALFVVMVMALSSMPQASLGAELGGAPKYTTVLEDYLEGWSRWDTAKPDGNTKFSCVTDEAAHTGNNSIVLRHTGKVIGNNAITIAQDGMSIPSGTYTVSFWAAGNYSIHANCITVNGQAWEDYYFSDFTVSEVSGIWTKYTLDITIPNGKTNNAFTFANNGDTSALYLDDISFVKKGTGENLLKNGGFEEKPFTPTYTAEYEEYFANWEIDGDAKRNESNVFSCVSNDFAHSGTKSVLLRHNDSSQVDKWVKIKQGNLNLGAGNYTLSFWATGTVAAPVANAMEWKQVAWAIGGKFTGGNDYCYFRNSKTNEVDGDWTKYSMNFTVAQGSTANEIHLATSGHTAGLYIDDICLVKDGTGENLLKNASFEEKAGGTEPPEEPDEPDVPEIPNKPTYTTALSDYLYCWSDWSAIEKDGNLTFLCVTDEIAHSGENSFVLRHVDSSKPSNLCLAQNIPELSAGTYTISFWAVGTTTDGLQAVTLADPWRKFPVTEFKVTETDGIWSKYEKTVTAVGGETAITFPTDGNTNGWYIDDISLVEVGTTENLIKNAGFEEKEPVADPDTPDVPEKPTYTTTYEDYFYGWSNWSAEEQDGELTFLCVTDELARSGNNSFVIRHVDSSKPSNLCLAQNIPSLEAGEYTISFWAVGATTDGLQASTLADPWKRYPINEFKITETDGVWSKYEKTVTADGGETALTFATDGNTNGWYIDDISLVKKGTEENILTNSGFEEKDPSIPAGDIVKEVVLKKNGQRIEKLDGKGDYSVTLVIDNHAVDTVLNVEQFVAVYDEDGVLYGMVYSTATTIEKATADGAFTKIETSFALPKGNFTVEYFAFDGRDTLNIVGNPNPHKVFEQN